MDSIANSGVLFDLPPTDMTAGRVKAGLLHIVIPCLFGDPPTEHDSIVLSLHEMERLELLVLDQLELTRNSWLLHDPSGSAQLSA